MNTGFAPRPWPLYGELSLRIRPSSRAFASRSSCSSAASRSIPNVHSYGYETNGTRSWRRIAAAGSPSRAGTAARSTAPGATSGPPPGAPTPRARVGGPPPRRGGEDGGVAQREPVVAPALAQEAVDALAREEDAA